MNYSGDSSGSLGRSGIRAERSLGAGATCTLDESLARTKLIPAAERMLWLWSDMRERWRNGERVCAEDYLHSELLGEVSAETAVDIIYAEYVLRERRGEDNCVQDYLNRFPQYASALSRQLELHNGLSLSESAEESPHRMEPDGPDKSAGLGIDSRIGRYIVVARLGVGGQSEVFRALHPDLNCEVVIKLGRDPSGQFRVSDDRLAKEGRLLASLQHPNLARVFDLGWHEGRPYLVMEYVRGRTLEQCARAEQRSFEEWALLLAKVARSASVAHRSGIFHLDIKPGNVLIDENNEPKLIDFGLSHVQDAWSDRRSEPGVLSGTLQYMAPEQADGSSRQVDHRADIFGLGGLLFFILTGHAPYPWPDFARLIEAIQRGEWDRDSLENRRIPWKLRRICARALSANPALRYTTAEAFARELETATRPALLRRHWRSAGAVAISLAVLYAGNSQWFGRSQSAPEPNQAGALVAGAPGESRPEDVAQAGGRSAAEARTALDVRVWDSGRYLRLAEVAPLRNGDEVRVQADVPAGQYASLFLVSSEGALSILAQLPASDRPQAIRFPADASQAAPLIGSRGTELILLCTRRSRPVSLHELQVIWSQEASWPGLPEMTVLRLDRSGVHIEQRDRGFGQPVSRPDPEGIIRARLDGLRQQLESKVDLLEGLAFAHAE